MVYYLQINDETMLSLPALANFSEEFSADGVRQISAGVDVQVAADIDSLVQKFIHFYAEDSIASISIVNENHEIIYTTKAYSKLNSMRLYLNITDDDAENIQDPILFTLDFQA